MKASVQSVEPKGTYDSKYGLMYKYEVHIGEHVGEYSSKKYPTKEADGFPFVIGSEVEYEFVDGQYPKIKTVSNWSGGGGGYSGKKGSNASFALSYAKDVLVADWVSTTKEKATGTLTTENMFDLADKMVKWINDN